jgi:hypothetical protein
MKHSVSWFIFNLHKKEMHTKQNSQDILSNCGWTCDEKSFTWGGDFQNIATSMLYCTLVPCSTVHWSHALLYTGPMLYCTLIPMLYCTLVPGSMDIDMQHGNVHVVRRLTCSMDIDMQHEHGHAARTRTGGMELDNDIHHGDGHAS